MPELFTTAAAKDPSILTNLLPIVLSSGQSSMVAFVAYNCQVEASFTSPEEVGRQVEAADVMPVLCSGSLIGLSSPTFDICRTWDATAAPARENESVTNDIPTLIFSGDFDPITPPIHVEDVVGELSNATLVEILGLAHDPVSTGGDCTVDSVSTFLEDPGSPLDTTCTDALVVDFLPDLASREASHVGSPMPES